MISEYSEERYILFSVTIDRIAKNLQKLKNAKMGIFGLRSVHLSCLLKLGHARDGLTGAELAEVCEVDKSLISRVIGELEERGYVTYEESDRKYRRRIILTPSGVKTLAEIRTLLVDAVKVVREDVSDEDMEVVYRVLHKMDANICTLIANMQSDNAEPLC